MDSASKTPTMSLRHISSASLSCLGLFFDGVVVDRTRTRS